ncbi:MAG: acetyl-CoA C-acyltransferase [Saprospiraceae bacterium]|nr:acetyl-CoA C-acyltransferase [Saprospiraceae bacterium]
MKFNPVYIVASLRTPIGSFGGIFKDVDAIQLGAKVVQEALNKVNAEPAWVDEVFIGNVVSANLGQAPARQVAIRAGLPDTVPCTTVNKVCSSGMKAVMIGAQSIMLGLNDLVVAGGTENMTQIPFYVPQARFGYKYGNATLVDGLVRDGLEDVYQQCAMGVFADQTATKYEISREDQDAYAISSYQRSAETSAKGIFKQEIVPVELPQRKGPALIIDEDEEFKKVNFEKIPGLRPAFTKDGTVTAANASTINDGASAIILASEASIKKHNLKPLARIVAFADAAHEPSLFTTAPTLATPLALKRAGLRASDIDYFEVNEAFAVVPLAFSKLMDLGPDKINIHGGAVSLGHPLGASGARIITTLNNVLHSKQGKYGLATICNGGGGASALILERMD